MSLQHPKKQKTEHTDLTCVFPLGSKHHSCWYCFYSATEVSSSVRQATEWPDLQCRNLSGDGEFAYVRVMKIYFSCV